MAKIIKGRVTAGIEGDFVVFIIGMRVNKPWKIHKWLPVTLAMPKMLKELYADKSSGFLGASFGLPVMVQYWRSAEDLIRYARTKDTEHFPAWVNFNKLVGQSGDVGIFHETYKVSAGQYESVYNNMPKTGLGRFAELVPAKGNRGSANSRLGLTKEDDSPIDPEGAVKA